MVKKYITQNRQKKNTLSDIFAFILERKTTSRREIEAETGFSWGTVSQNVALLIEKGYVVEEKSENTGAGRTAYILKPSTDKTVSIGLDINLSGLSCEVVALDSRIISKFEADLTARTQSGIIAEAESLLESVNSWCSENSLTVFSLGIAMQGSVNGRLGVSSLFPNIPDWEPINIKEHFAAKYALPVYLGHDPKCMLLGQTYKEKTDNCVLLRVDGGIGMAVSLDGTILDDTDRFELGHTLAVPNGKKCSCGKRGCLEAYGSLSAIGSGTDAVMSSPEKFEKELREAGKRLSAALYNTYIMFRPQKLILTGKAASLSAFTEGALSSLDGCELDISVDPGISAAYGAAVESIRSAVRSFII